MQVLRSFRDIGFSQSYSLEIFTERNLNNKAVLFIFGLSTVFYTADILVTNYHLEPKSTKASVLAAVLVLLFLRAMGFIVHIKYHIHYEEKWFRVFEMIFAFLFVSTSILVWNTQLNMDFQRAFIVGLDIAWFSPYVLTIFGKWKYKALIDLSVVIFAIIKLSLHVKDFSMGQVQAACQLIFVMALLYAKEKTRKFQFSKTFSLQKNEQTLKAILDNIPENIAVLNLEGDLIYYNDYLDICFDLSGAHENNEIDALSHFHTIKPRERYFNFESSHTTDTYAVPVQMPMVSLMQKQQTTTASKKKFPIKKITMKSAAKPPSDHNPHLKEEDEFRRKKESSAFNMVTIDKTTSAMQSARSKNMRESHTSLTEAISSKDNFASLQDVIDFFVANLTQLRNYQDKTSNFFIFDCKYKSPDDSRSRSFEIKISLASFDGDESLILILRDTTHRDIIATLEGNNSFKDSVLASISHELRTPLNPLLNMLDVAIKDLSIPDTSKESSLIPAYKSGKLLKSCINDVLDYSLLIAHKLKPRYKSKFIMNTLNKVKYLIEAQAAMKGLKFSIIMDPSIHPKCLSDHRRLRQILINLLTNAIKFTMKGEIGIKIEPWGLDQKIIKISVFDTGIGMNYGYVERIRAVFRKNEFIEKLSESTQHGIGVGLMMAHLVAKRLGPKIAKLSGLKIESREEEGSTFWFYLDTHRGNSLVSSPVSAQIDIGNNLSVQNEGESVTQIHHTRGDFSHSQVISDHNQEEMNTITLMTEGNNTSQVKLVGARYKLVRLATIDRKKDMLPDIFVTEELREATLGEEDLLEEENAMMIKDNNIRGNQIDTEISRIEGFRRSQPRLLTSTSGRAPNESIIIRPPDFGKFSFILNFI